METLLHLPISNRDLFVAKLLGAYIPAVVVSWVGFALFCVVTNAVAWGVMHRIFVPTRLWAVVIFWVAPAVALLGLGVMVRVSVRARSTQEANQLGGAVVLPLIFLAVGQSTGLLLLDLPVAVAIGAAVSSSVANRDNVPSRLSISWISRLCCGQSMCEAVLISQNRRWPLRNSSTRLACVCPAT